MWYLRLALWVILIVSRVSSFQRSSSKVRCCRSAPHAYCRLFAKSRLQENLLVKALDKNGDGVLSIKEAIGSPLDILQNSLVSNHYKTFLRAFQKWPSISASFWPQIQKITDPADFVIIVALMLTHKALNRLLFDVTKRFRKKEDTTTYAASFLGHIERPVACAILFFPFIYLLDVSTILFHSLGFDFHVKGDLPRLVCTVYEAVTCGSLVVSIKNWVLVRSRRDAVNRDHTREVVIDELTSSFIWLMMAGFCLEAMSLEFGFALGSIFAVGGIGSASAVLALRGTMENFIGGLVLKIQDKFRVGEKISIPGAAKGGHLEEGKVEEINFFQTTIRRLDNSLVTVPNHMFTQSQVINWSRTPYRLFQTSLTVPLADFSLVPKIVNDVETGLKALNGVEYTDRELLVSASGFKDGKITLEVEAHLKTSDDLEEGRLRTEVVRVIAQCCAPTPK